MTVQTANMASTMNSKPLNLDLKVKKALAILKSLPIGIIGSLLALPVVLIVRIIRPIIHIRFGAIRTDRIGHFAIESELYLCQQERDGLKTIDWFYFMNPICNEQLMRMYKRKLKVNGFVRWLDFVNQRIPFGDVHTVVRMHPRDTQGLTTNSKSHLSFTAEEDIKGRQILNKLGMAKQIPFVCVHSRDNAYLSQMFPKNNWEYHNYRDSSIRNYIPACEHLVKNGYFVFRTGSIVEEPLDLKTSEIVDYANGQYQSDFMDIYLGANCKFYVCSAVGVSAIAMLFRRPIAFVNFVPLEHAWTWGKDDLFIPKKLWLKKEKRFMTFKETIDMGASLYLQDYLYRENGLEVVENSPEEITALVSEMNLRLAGEWQESEEDVFLQSTFWDLFPDSEYHGKKVSRIGSQFLRDNKELLV